MQWNRGSRRSKPGWIVLLLAAAMGMAVPASGCSTSGEFVGASSNALQAGGGAGNGNGGGNAPDAGGGGGPPDAGNGGGPPDAGNGGGPPDAGNGLGDRTIDPRRSLVVTEQPILAGFSLERVLAQLASQSGVQGLTALDLFQQLWDTQNPAPGTRPGPHCDDQVDALGYPQINGYPYTCRPAPAEGADASCDPFAAESPCAFVPIGLFNRFDLAPADGAHCGEHRIVFARTSGVASAQARNLLIFEFYLPNPHPLQGLMGCRPIVDVWADLTDEADPAARAASLEQFYFEGVNVVPAVVDPAHLGANAEGLGQLRTNQFLQPDPPRAWSLREFKLEKTCSAEGCTAMRFVPVTNKGNPWGGLFSPTATHPNAASFQQDFVAQVPSLAAGSLIDFTMSVSGIYDSALSEASGSIDTNYLANLGPGPSAFHEAIGAAASAAGSSLTPEQLVRRAQVFACAGCHRLSNGADLGGGLVWPPSLGFTHVTERDPEVVDGVTRFRISEALIALLLPHRQRILEDYLNGRPINARSQHAPIGGFLVH